jgi:hypothetical protein
MKPRAPVKLEVPKNVEQEQVTGNDFSATENLFVERMSQP